MKEENNGSIICEELFFVSRMIELYYRAEETPKMMPLERMWAYATKRLQHCLFGEKKTTCQKCPVHCYQATYRQQMKQIMRYAGPRMLWRHPVLTLRHAIRGNKRRNLR